MRERRAAVRQRALGLFEREHARACDVFLLQVDQDQGLDDLRIHIGAQIDDRAHARALSCWRLKSYTAATKPCVINRIQGCSAHGTPVSLIETGQYSTHDCTARKRSHARAFSTDGRVTGRSAERSK